MYLQIVGPANAMMKHCKSVDGLEDVVGIVGTGGDGANTVNISTGASILAAACGAKVAKVASQFLLLNWCVLGGGEGFMSKCERVVQIESEYLLIVFKYAGFTNDGLCFLGFCCSKGTDQALLRLFQFCRTVRGACFPID